MSVRVENITKKYGDQIAVNNISFTAEKGQILGFLGPNGAGKSTTMRMITGYTASDNGAIYVSDHEVGKHPLITKNSIGYLPESNPIYHDMYVPEYLAFVGSFYSIADLQGRIEEVISITGLTPERRKKIHQLSKGYKQRVGLAQAILHDPEVLILDEPTSGLDPNQLVEIRSLIKRLGQEKTVIFSSHIMQEVQAICDKVVILDKGVIVANDEIQILQRSLNNEVSVFVEFQKPINESALMTIEGVIRVEKTDGGKHLWTNQDIDIRGDLFDLAVNQGNRILEMKKNTASVEDVFKAITN